MLRQNITTFLELFDVSQRSQREPVECLERALDALIYNVHCLSFEFDETEYPDAPKVHYGDTREKVAAVFSSFGFYNVVSSVSLKGGQAEVVMGDAIDDLTDIYLDMREVLWRLENTSEPDAMFHFQLGYRSHWGRHARDLLLYIHDNYWF